MSELLDEEVSEERQFSVHGFQLLRLALATPAYLLLRLRDEGWLTMFT